MKFILIIVVLAAAAWVLMTKAKQNAVIQQVQQAPVTYTKSLQNDVSRAKTAEEAASKAIKQTGQDVEKAVEAQ